MTRIVLSTLMLMFVVFACYGQITVHGTVLSKTDGEPLVGASVLDSATKEGVATDLDGNFTIVVSEGANLTISYVGFVPQTVLAQAEMTISLEENAAVLDEVVVVGYSTQKKADVTGAITAVNVDDMAKANENTL